jgi:RNA polymerase sigma factor (TIGR02999 family)
MSAMSAMPEGPSSIVPPEGDGSHDLMEAVYTELHRLATMLLRGEVKAHSLPATALVHEAYIKLMQSPSRYCESREHFVAIAARAMRQILVDHARGRRAARRGGTLRRVTLERVLDLAETEDLDLVALDDSLRQLERMDPVLSSIVELRFFGGLSMQETARHLSMPEARVKRHWQLAKGWLYQEISGGRPGQP